MTTTVNGTQLYDDAIRRIQELEKLNATLSTEIDAQRQRQQALSEAYLRLRRLIGQAAFETPHGPTPEQVWTTTEIALAVLAEEAERMRPVVEAAIKVSKDPLFHASLLPLREALEVYQLNQPK